MMKGSQNEVMFGAWLEKVTCRFAKLPPHPTPHAPMFPLRPEFKAKISRIGRANNERKTPEGSAQGFLVHPGIFQRAHPRGWWGRVNIGIEVLPKELRKVKLCGLLTARMLSPFKAPQYFEGVQELLLATNVQVS